MDDGTKDKVKANEVAGRVKRGMGEALDVEDLKKSGDKQEAKGKAQNALGEVKSAVNKATKR